jgi:NAD(P)-dependent dehydrogenase (short-subunit alcohol dehydrogenase family)
MTPSRWDGLLETSVVGSFSNIGYRVRSRGWDELEGGIAGRTAVITGATSGLGLETATQLAELEAKPILVARNEEKAQSVVAEIIRQTGNPDVSYALADLSSLDQVRRLSDQLLDTFSDIHILVNNAGVLPNGRVESVDGIELTLATNLVGSFLLTNLLIPRMVASAPARIINVSSGGMYTQRIDTTDLQSSRGDFNGTVAYAQTKRGQVILTELWAERLAGTGVVVNAMHPGWVNTPGVKDWSPAFQRIMRPLLRSPSEGADTIVWLAAADETETVSGGFWHDRELRPTHRSARTQESAPERAELWEALTRLSGWDLPPDWPRPAV